MSETVRWAIAAMTVLIILAFLTPKSAPQFLLVGMIAVTLYLAVDASRIRLSTALHTAVHVYGDDEISHTTDPPELSDWEHHVEWGDPLPTISYWEILSRRLRQRYFFLYLVLGGAWLVYLTLYSPGEAWSDTAAIPGVPGRVVVSIVIGFYLLLVILTLWPMQRHPADE